MTFSFIPRRMRADAASFYLGVSEQTFRDRVKAGVYPPGFLDGSMRLWLRDDLDAMVDRQAGVAWTAGAAPANDADADADDPFVARFKRKA